ncbi:hypothetical protein C8Q72DRAFT_884690 [Fomitopsis betulina]|nr:hypothetical protein C8Q72DRAFT_884690 [Fomitopsis betulina]
MITQASLNFSTYKQDLVWIKTYVAVLLLADTVNAAFDLAWIYGVLINKFGNEEALGIVRASWQQRCGCCESQDGEHDARSHVDHGEERSFLMETGTGDVDDLILNSFAHPQSPRFADVDEAMTGIIAMQVQFFYTWRLHKLTGNKNKLVVDAIVSTSLVGGLSGIGTSIGVGMIREFAKLQRLKIIVSLWLFGAAICDVGITFALTWHLREHRTGFARTDTVINRITQIIVSNGLLTAIFAVADIIAFLSTDKSYHLIFNFPLSKLYGNSAMSSLNARSILVGSSSNSVPTHRGDGTPDVRTPLSAVGSNLGQIMVSVERHEMADVVAVGRPRDDAEWQKSFTESDAKAMAL